VEVALDAGGALGIVHGERWVRHVDRRGTIRTVGEFDQPTALAYDGAGDLWVSELGGRVVRRNRVTGARTAFEGFDQPHGLDVAADGTVYVCDTLNNRVRRISPTEEVSTLAAGLALPVDLDVGPDGNVYVADSNGARVIRITPQGSVSSVRNGLVGTQTVAVGADLSIYVAERGRPAITRIRP
jgi:sugar lactone lactonase YvrE